MSSLRAVLRKSPLAVSVYHAAKNAARSVFRFDHSVEPGALGSTAPSPASTNGPQPDADAKPGNSAASPAWKPTDFDIYHQYPPHVFYTFRDRDAIFRDAVTAYSNVSVEEEPSGLHTDPIRVLQFSN